MGERARGRTGGSLRAGAKTRFKDTEYYSDGNELAHILAGTGAHGRNAPAEAKAGDVDVCWEDFPQKDGLR